MPETTAEQFGQQVQRQGAIIPAPIPGVGPTTTQERAQATVQKILPGLPSEVNLEKLRALGVNAPSRNELTLPPASEIEARARAGGAFPLSGELGTRGVQPPKVPADSDEVHPVRGPGVLPPRVGLPKRETTAEEFAAQAAAHPADAVTAQQAVRSPTLSEAIGTMAEQGLDPMGMTSPEMQEQTVALMSGFARGVIDIPAGVEEERRRWGAEGEAGVQQLRASVADLEEKLGTAEMARRQPFFSGMGETLGVGTAVLGTTILGAAGVAAAGVAAVPAWLASVVGGGILGATTFHREDVSDAWRWGETAFMSLAGVVGKTVWNGMEWSTKYLADRETFNWFTRLMKAGVGEVGTISDDLGNAYRRAFRTKYEQAKSKYSVSKETGEEFEGFDPERMAGAVKEWTTPNTKVVAAGVRERLGLKTDVIRQKAEDEYKRELAKWQKIYVEPLNRGAVRIEDLPVSVRERLMAQLPARPEMMELPEQPRPSAKQFADARQYLTRQHERATGRAKHEIGKMRDNLMEEAERAGREFGMSGEEFVRAQQEADEFFATDVGPFRDWLGGSESRKITPDFIDRDDQIRKFSNKQIRDRFSRALKENDPAEMVLIGKFTTEPMKRQLQRMVEWEMLQTLGPTAQRTGEVVAGRIPYKTDRGEKVLELGRYIERREAGLVAMLGRDRVEELKGMSHIGQRLMEAGTDEYKHMWHWGTRSVLPFIGMERFIEKSAHGQVGRGLTEAAGLIATPYAAHALFHLFGRMRSLPSLMPGVRAASKMKPDSLEMDKLLQQMQRRVIGGTLAGGRAMLQSIDNPEQVVP